MPRDYAPSKAQGKQGRKRSSRRGSPAKARQGASPLLAFFGGMACGAVGATLVALLHDSDAPSAVAEQPAAEQAAESAPPPSLTYEFIDRLAREQVIVDAKVYQPPPAADRGQREYLLQAASFRSREDADTMRAQLILEGMDVAVDAVPRSGGGAWHRVLVGPFARKIDMERTLTKLRTKDIPAFAIERALRDPA